MLTQLLWKQYKEHSWRIAFATVMLCAFVAIGLRTRISRDQDIFILSVVLGSMLLPIFIAMGLIAPQRADGSHLSVVSLPVSRSRLLGVTLAAGMLGCIVPMLINAATFTLLAGPREIDTRTLWLCSLAGIYMAVLSLY